MSTTQTQTIPDVGSLSLNSQATPRRAPLVSSGALSHLKQFDVTPVIGREFPDVQLSSLLTAPNSDELIKELAILISERGVAFFRSQDLTIPQQKELGLRLGSLSGNPKESTLHIHPITEETSELGDEISIIDSDRNKKGYADRVKRFARASNAFHSDITFEKVPSDFAILKIHTLPETGGDTLWASAYETYDRLSPAYKKFVEGLTAVHEAKFFHTVAANLGNKLREGIRGHPDNEGPELETIHPVVRTNPVTGWKGLFVNRGFTKRIVELSPDESDQVLNYLFDLVSQNHDLQVRLKWNKNDVAIWNNSSTVHSATFDYEERRSGDRVVSIGEHPYFDPASVSRREALEAREKAAAAATKA